MKILILGADGMLGHITTLYFQKHGYSVITTSRQNSGDYYYDVYENVYGITHIISKTHPDVIINCIGLLNQAAENDHAKATLINSFLPNYLDSLSSKNHFYLIHITTDCVFSGSTGNYTEVDAPDAQSFYGRSKALGEFNNNRNLTIRTSIVGPDTRPDGIGLFQWFSQQTGTVKGYSKVFWSGVTTLELAKQMEKAIKDHWTGLVHVVNNQKIAKANLLRLFDEHFNLQITVINDDTIKSDKSLKKTNQTPKIDVPNYNTMIKELRTWVDDHADLYHILKERMHQ